MTTTAAAEGCSIDDLARLAGVPVRTIREYQTLQLLPPPSRQGRVGVYDHDHLARLQVIGRLQHRGYSLAGIRDLLDAWSGGRDLAAVLGDADDLPMPDEAGLVMSRSEIRASVGRLPAASLADLEECGLLQPRPDGQVCVLSPSLLRLVADATTHGVGADDAIEIARSVTNGARAVAVEVAQVMRRALADTDDVGNAIQLVRRGRALLAQGTARLVVHELASALAELDAESESRSMTRLIDAARVDPLEVRSE